MQTFSSRGVPGPVVPADVNCAVPRGAMRIIGERAVIEALTDSDRNRIRYLLLGNHRDRSDAWRWLKARGLQIAFGQAE